MQIPTLNEIYAMQREIDEQVMEVVLANARAKAAMDMMQVFITVQNCMMSGLIMGGMLNPNFCKAQNDKTPDLRGLDDSAGEV